MILKTLLLLLAFAFPANAATYYISPSGSGDGSTPSVPQALSWANTNAAAGDTIVMLGGNYATPLNPANSGTSNTARVTFQAYGDSNIGFTDICGGTIPNSGCIRINEKKYITISGQSFQSASDTHRYINFTAPARAPGFTSPVIISLVGTEGVIVEKTEFICLGQTQGNHSCTDGVYVNDPYSAYSVVNESKWNVLRNNRWQCEGNRLGGETVSYTEDCLLFEKGTHHNLLEDTTVITASHVTCCATGTLKTQHSNVLRRNRFDSWDHSSLNVYRQAGHWLIENNISLSTYDAIARNGRGPGGPEDGESFQWDSPFTIARGNQFLYGLQSGGIAGGCNSNGGLNDSRFYNNTVAKGSELASVNLKDFGDCLTSPSGLGNIKFVNNLFWRPGTGSDKRTVINWDDVHDTALRVFWNNIFGLIGIATDITPIITTQNPNGPGGSITKTLVLAKSDFTAPGQPDFRDRDAALAAVTPPATGVWKNTYNSDTAMVVDYASHPPNLTPVAGSALIDTGGPLTVVVSGCNSTSIVVEDALWFYDKAGDFPVWMGVQYDTVRIGATFINSPQAQLTGVNHTTNTLTFGSSFACTNGDPVWFAAGSDGIVRVQGNAPDIGAVEFSPITASPVFFSIR